MQAPVFRLRSGVFFIRIILSFYCAASLPVFSQAQQKFQLFSPSTEPLPAKALKGLSKGLRLTPSLPAIKAVYDLEPESFLLDIPLPDGGMKSFVLYKTRVVSDDFRVTTSDGKEFRGKKFSGVHYQIRPGLQPERVGAISFSENEVAGLFSDEKGNWNLGLLPEGKGDYIVFCEKDLLVNSGFACATPESDIKVHGQSGQEDKSVQSTGTCKVVRMYFECDFKMFQDNGSSTANTSSKISSMFSMVQQLFSNEQIAIELDQVFVWVSTDPYATTTTSSAVLNAFTTNRQSITQKLGHLVSTRSANMGGIAWLDVVCNSAFYNYRYGFSNIYNTFSAVPTFSWSVYCMTHEIGHNFGSNHTHWCGWTGGAIDNCYTTEPNGATTCSPGPAVTNGGTIMSYCHLTAAGINFTKGFGTLPGNRIRTGFACITGSPIPSFTLGSNRSVCTGENISLNASTSTSGATFAWTGPNNFTSSQQNPIINSATAAAAGDYSCKVTASGCTSDQKTTSVIVNAAGAPPVSEGFTSSTFPPSGWRIANPDQDITWARNTTVGGFGASTNSMVLDNLTSPSTSGKRDTLFLPVIDLSTQSSASLEFDVAYRWNGSTHDSLCVIVSSDCGRRFQRVYKKSGSTLATVSTNSSSRFTPTSSQWRKETISLSAYNGQPKVQVAFANYSGASNLLYVDNINLSTSSGSPNTITLNALTQSSFCPGQSVSIGFSSTGTFNGGNSFNVELSNASGSFTSPTVIGTGTASPVSATIPAAAITGNGYLIRVVSSSPTAVSGTSQTLSIAPISVSAGADQSVCSNAGSINLTGTPSGGTWSGSGVSASGVFTPATALVGNQTLTYSASSGGCSGSDQLVITVKSVPTVNAGTDQSTCSQSSAFTLTGFSPSGGTWSGNGVSASGTFTPSSSLVGNNTLTYSFTQNGCTGTDAKVVSVSATIPVSAGQAQTTCTNGSAITLSGSPSGGTWSGNGVSASGIFTPSTSLSGSNTLTYTVSSACAGSAQTTVTVNAVPVVNAGTDQSTCSQSSAFTLTGFSPSGGTWSGNGVSASGTFTPSSSLVGNNTLTYSFTQNGCTGTDAKVVSVSATIPVSAGQAQTTCTNGTAITLSGSPSGGTWSGNGVSASGIFTPSTSLSGSNTLTYTVSGACAGSAQTTVTVNAVPVVNAGSNQSLCSNAPALSLSGFSPSGGTWSGNGVSSQGVFTPSASLVGNQSLTYTVVSNGCSGTGQIIVTVKPVPTVQAGSDQSICASAAPFVLTGFSPSGGSFSGPGILQDSIFEPSAALIGTRTITYSVTQNGCTGTDSKIITITPSVSLFLNPANPQKACATDQAFTLSCSPAGGIWKGNGISASGLFTPSAALIGTQTLFYRLNQNGCRDSIEVSMPVFANPVVNAGPDLTACSSGNPVQLSGFSPAGGFWSGPGVVTEGIFSPASVSPGVFTLTYTLFDGNGCSGSDVMQVTVSSSPQVNAGDDRTICANSEAIQLTANPLGGIWSGAGVNASGLYSSGGGTGTVQLTYTLNQDGCSGSDVVQITTGPELSIDAGSSQSICSNDEPFSLTGFSPAGGSWSGNGVNTSGVFSPSVSLIGNQVLTYRIVQPNCIVSAQKTITVKVAPEVSAGPDQFFCSNDASAQLSNFSPAGGIWSGNGVSPDGQILPGQSGSLNLTYSVTVNGCTAEDQKVLTIIPAPEASAGTDRTLCGLVPAFFLTGATPSGGTWSGNGVSASGFFMPTSSMLGTSVQVVYNAQQDGCQDKDTLNILVVDFPLSSSINAASLVSCQGDTIQLSLNSGSTGTGLQYQWKKDGLPIEGANASIFGAIQSGIYQASISKESCNLSSDEKSLVFHPVPERPIITQNANELTSSASAGNQWLLNGLEISGATNPLYVAVQSGLYSVVVTENNCPSMPSLPVFVTITGMEVPEHSTERWLLSPNPARDKVFISCKGRLPEFHLNLLDATGRQLRSFDGKITGEAEVLDISGLPAGVYWLRPSDAGQFFRGARLVIQ